MTSSVLPHNQEARDALQEASVRRKRPHPSDGRHYDPNNYKVDFGSKQPPATTIVVLQTPDLNGNAEYRVGILKRSDLQVGLRNSDGTSLNKHITERRFTGRVYHEEGDALKAAEQRTNHDNWPDGGIKVIRCIKQFPGVYSSSGRHS